MKESCNEKLDLEFISWVWSFKKRERNIILNKIKKLHKSKKIIILSKPKKVSNFIKILRKCLKI